MADPGPRRRNAMWIIPVIVVAIVLVIFVGYNAVYMKQDAQRDQGTNVVQPDAPG